MRALIKTGFIFLFIVLQSCGSKLSEERRLLQGEWQFKSVYSTQGSYSQTVSPEDRLRISQDYSFSYKFQEEGELYTGSWETGRDNTLLFIYHQRPGQNRLSSVEYVIDSLSPEILILRDPNGLVYNLEKPE